jgi:hypothetical protein
MYTEMPRLTRLFADYPICLQVGKRLPRLPRVFIIQVIRCRFKIDFRPTFPHARQNINAQQRASLPNAGWQLLKVVHHVALGGILLRQAATELEEPPPRLRIVPDPPRLHGNEYAYRFALC